MDVSDRLRFVAALRRNAAAIMVPVADLLSWGEDGSFS
jgi:hypothetical protein